MSVKCRVRSVKCKVWSEKCKVWIVTHWFFTLSPLDAALTLVFAKKQALRHV